MSKPLTLLHEGATKAVLKVAPVKDDESFYIFIDYTGARTAFNLTKQQALTLAEFIITLTQDPQNG